MATTLYAIALGANRYGRHGRPSAAIVAALAAIGGVEAVSPIIASAPIGPSTRMFANAAALIRSDEPPPALLARLKAIERRMGRRPGIRWGARPIDLDIILWSGGPWRTRTLTIPHPAFRDRRFVLGPLARIAARWRDPISGLRVRHLLSQVDRRRPRT
ncbi:2-amino-4-hydroxy-6-hydroxymethyldihydropteridine diphosphokinase [Sphingomonas mollis]|uniref:2-amino-4-hydroxy-6-hydroxymethyldihydropteridine pyrophosphokinase n=1 Tax=Sphingomonas mollis TaxID=2795726 RepID=A0ABS0XR08_9SPHN|nr:2-amino-4-hydroxy-6-hydroxymethyldihydropteridine diphosphokinase [Sphingomonas sp. BT553]MBJ6122467.1 2-amino-4-hydroxy-6-hydroxymethyldihydropteridine diphosphokinase [Sphingomonas sp. BT553]